jgi:hypothetical protein
MSKNKRVGLLVGLFFAAMVAGAVKVQAGVAGGEGGAATRFTASSKPAHTPQARFKRDGVPEKDTGVVEVEELARRQNDGQSSGATAGQ